MNEKIQTPFFMIREEILQDNIKGFREALDQLWPRSIIAYSEKTNALPWILKWMNDHGVYAEVVSDEEYQIALLSGFPDERIVFNGPIKGDKMMRRAFEAGAIINLDSAREVDFILREKPSINGNLGIRVNIDPQLFDAKDVGYRDDGFRFGFSEKSGDLKRVVDKLSRLYSHRHFGLHLHVNSISRAPRVYKVIAAYAAAVIRKFDLEPAYLDIGGGFFGGVPGKATPREYLEAVLSGVGDIVDIEKTFLIIEPGSAAIASAVELHTSVLDVKDTERARIVTTDGSRIYIDPLWQKKTYCHYTDSVRKSFPRQIICGYTCMDHDRLMVLENEAELSCENRIVYQRVGNYTVTLGGPFIKPLPAVYAEINGEIKLIRTPMSVDDFYRMENVKE